MRLDVQGADEATVAHEIPHPQPVITPAVESLSVGAEADPVEAAPEPTEMDARVVGIGERPHDQAVAHLIAELLSLRREHEGIDGSFFLDHRLHRQSLRVEQRNLAGPDHRQGRTVGAEGHPAGAGS